MAGSVTSPWVSMYTKLFMEEQYVLSRKREKIGLIMEY